jgi:hypothetical protein
MPGLKMSGCGEGGLGRMKSQGVGRRGSSFGDCLFG